jgi:hypothetical protein
MSEDQVDVKVPVGSSIVAATIGMARAYGSDGSLGITLALFQEDLKDGPIAHTSMSLESARGFAQNLIIECDKLSKEGVQ